MPDAAGYTADVKSSVILRDVRRQVAASPAPLDHRSWPTGSGCAGVTKAEILARLDADIAYFEEQEQASITRATSSEAPREGERRVALHCDDAGFDVEFEGRVPAPWGSTS